MIEKLSKIERKVLQLLKKYNKESEIIENSKIDQGEVRRALLLLQNKNLIKLKRIPIREIVITERGKECLSLGFPEERVYKYIKDNVEIEIEKVRDNFKEVFNIAIGVLKSLNLISIDQGIVRVLKDYNFEKYPLKEKLKRIAKGEKVTDVKDLLRRGLIRVETKEDSIIELTKEGLKAIEELGKYKEGFIEKLTHEILLKGSWRGKKFREYDVVSKVPKLRVGRRSLLKRLEEKIKEIWLSLGFEEMEGDWVTTSFFNFDLMFFSQDHPDREIMGTYYIWPEEGEVDSKVNKILKKVYLDGYNTGSKGKNEIFDEKKTKRLILRTHTTAITFQYLYRNLYNKIKVGKKLKIPGKYFMIGRVFRVDVFDYKHLPEFHQVEGFVIDKNLSFKDLLSYLKEFYSYFGIKKLRFKPVYNPYTEPSSEIFAWLEEKRKWIEIGNSGMFRKETLIPLGIKQNIIAWGLALERLAMLVYGIDDIRKVHGYMVDIEDISKSKATFEIR